MAARISKSMGSFGRDLLYFPRTGWWTHLPLNRTLAKASTTGDSNKSIQSKAKAEVFKAKEPPHEVLKTQSSEDIDDNTKYRTEEYYQHTPLSFIDDIVNTRKYRQDQPSPSIPYFHPIPEKK